MRLQSESSVPLRSRYLAAIRSLAGRRLHAGPWILGALLVGCADDPTSDETFCIAECDTEVRCGVPFPRSECIRLCNRSNLDEVYRGEAIEAAAECISDLRCIDLDSSAPFRPCWERAATEVAPTQETREYCASYSTAIFECGGWYSTADCERDYSIINDDFLSKLARCQGETSCDDFDTCLEATWNAP